MAEYKYNYDLSELENLNDGFGGFIELRAWDDDGHEVSIITNKSGEGFWEKIHTPFGVEYRQTMGTLQYRLPDTDGKIRQQLAAKLNARLSGGYYD